MTAQDVVALVPDITNVGEPMVGGQKIVFPCTIRGKRCVVKFMLPKVSAAPSDEEDESTNIPDEVTARARREVQIMQQCNTPYLVKLGPLPLTIVDFKGQSLLYFAEEFIEGSDLRHLLRHQGTFSVEDLLRLGRHISEAIRVLWALKKVHRDIKPGNIMQRATTSDFVLLDMGLAFDLEAESITMTGFVPGTPGYFSPEQLEFTRKRQLDFRSDLFSLGIVLYEAATGIHPFVTPFTRSTTEVAANILGHNPLPPSHYRSDLPEELSDIIMRLIAKSPHLRYRTCEKLDSAFAHVQRSQAGG
ncbi:MAG: serine/threonine-protein kinase [bacterium]